MAEEKTYSGEQKDRFRKAARELGADESDDALDRVMGKLDLKKPKNNEGKPEQDGGR